MKIINKSNGKVLYGLDVNNVNHCLLHLAVASMFAARAMGIARKAGFKNVREVLLGDADRVYQTPEYDKSGTVVVEIDVSTFDYYY